MHVAFSFPLAHHYKAVLGTVELFFFLGNLDREANCGLLCIETVEYKHPHQISWHSRAGVLYLRLWRGQSVHCLNREAENNQPQVEALLLSQILV